MTLPSYEQVLLEVDGGVAFLRLNRPDKLNAITPHMQAELIDALSWLERNDDIRAVVLSGEGRAFSAGFDIGGSREGPEPTVAQWRDRLAVSSFRFARTVWSFKKPLIAATQGYCLGAACELAMLCDMTIASADCRFGEPETRFGSGSPALIMPWVVPMKAAKELLYTGRHVSAQRAYELGMVNHVVEPDELQGRAHREAELLARMSPLAVQIAKEGLNRTYEIMGLVNALAYNETLIPLLYGTETDESRAFGEARAARGLRAALKEREALLDEVDDLA